VRCGTSFLTRSKNIGVRISFELVIPEMFNVGDPSFQSDAERNFSGRMHLARFYWNLWRTD